MKNMDARREDWESIVQAHTPLAFDVAWRLLGHAADTEDAVQDALLDAFRLHARQPVNNWGALVRHLATRRAIDRLRKRREAPLVPLATFEVTAPASEQPEAVAAGRDLAERLRWAIAELPEREASVFSLRYFGEMANSEIAQTLGISEGAVGVALHKARARLKELLGLEASTSRRPRS
jgi:RNA polymerase sigma-70 factor (ECF subfamily)